MSTIKVILVDDDTDLGDLVSSCLIDNGYGVHYQNTLFGLENIIEAFKPSILVLDVEIGLEDGITHAKNIIQKYPSVPILFISSHIETDDVTRGIISGGVGYLRKPFDMEEVCAYIERFAVPVNSVDKIQFGSYSLSITTRELFLKDSIEKQLSRLEFNLLHLLLENANNIVTHETIAETIWQKDYQEIEHTLNNLISKLRKILNEDTSVDIDTIKNVGYKLKAKVI